MTSTFEDRGADDSPGMVESFELESLNRSVAGVDTYTASADIDGEQRTVEIHRPRLQGSIAETEDAYLDAVRTWETTDDNQGILSVLDWGTTVDGPWVATEQFSVETLRDRCDSDDIDVETAIEITINCLQALGHSHEQRVSHLALTPARILLDGTRPAVSALQTGQCLESMGGLDALTPAYAAPEQFDPEQFGEPDQRTDIYRLGVICYELLTGQRPYSGSTTALVDAVTDPDHEPVPPSEQAPVPAALDDVLASALATNPGDRYTTAEGFEAALRDIDGIDSAAGGSGTEQPDTGWQQFGGGPAQTRHAPAMGPSESPELDWTVDTGYHEVQSAPAVADGVVYFGGNDDAVHAVDIETGTEQWAVDMPRVIDTAPAVARDTVFVASDDTLHALDVATGETRWTVETGGFIRSSPTVTEDTVVLGSDDEHVYALDSETGDKRWQVKTEGPVQSTPAISDGTVYIGSHDQSLYAIDLETGEQEWRCSEDLKKIRTAPAVRYDTVYVTAGGTVHALDADSGDHRWQFAPDSRTLRSPAVDAGTVFVGCEYAGLYAIDADTGDQQWAVVDHETVLAPAVSDGVVYAHTEDGTLYGIATDDGDSRWSVDLGEGATTAPGLSPSGLFVGGEDGSLMAVRGDSGTDDQGFGTAGGDLTLPAVADMQSPNVSWQTASATPGRTRHVGGGGPDSRVVTMWKLDPDATLSPPTMDQNAVYVGDDKNNLLAIDSESGDVHWRVDAGTDDERDIVTDGDSVYSIGATFPNDRRKQATEGGDTLYVLERDTGEQRWQADGRGELATPTVAGNVVYLLDDGGVRALATDTGEPLWETDATGEHSPAVGYGTVYIAGEGTLTALDAGVGTDRWSVDCPRFVVGPPALADECLYLTDDEGDVLAFDAETGEKLWRSSVGDEMQVGVAIEDETVYAASANGQVTALEASTGDQRWQQTTGESVQKPIAVAENLVYLSTRETLYALDTADGSEQWTYSASGAGYMHAPVVGSEMLALVDENRDLRGLVPRE